MKIEFECPHCDAELSAESREAGKRARCPECRQDIRIPVSFAVPRDTSTDQDAGESAAAADRLTLPQLAGDDKLELPRARGTKAIPLQFTRTSQFGGVGNWVAGMDVHQHVLLCAAWFLLGLTWAILAPWMGLLHSWIMEPLHVVPLLITVSLIVWTFVRATRVVMRTGRPLLTLPYSLTHLFLFLLLFFQISVHIGADFYKWDSSPSWYHWVQFTFAHAVRAGDVFDLVEAYGFKVQTIHHASFLVGACLFLFHFLLDLFVLGVVLGLLWRRRGPSRALRSSGEDAIVLLLLVVLLFTALFQGWRLVDYVLWPVDNALHVIDFTDVMILSGTRLHSVPTNLWSGTLAFVFRVFIFVAFAEVFRSVSTTMRLRWMGGLGLTTAELEEIAKSHDNPAMQRRAEDRLAYLSGWEDKESNLETVSFARVTGELGALDRDKDDDKQPALFSGNPRDRLAVNLPVHAKRKRISPDHWHWPALRDSLSVRNWAIAGICALALVIIAFSFRSWQAASDRLGQTASDPGNQRAFRALRALRRLGSHAQGAERPLVDAFFQMPQEQQLAVLETLGHSGGADAVTFLSNHLETKNEHFALRSAHALQRIGPKTAPILARAAFYAPRESVRAATKEAVLRMGDEAVPILFESVLGGGEHDERRTCVVFLDELDPDWPERDPGRKKKSVDDLNVWEIVRGTPPSQGSSTYPELWEKERDELQSSLDVIESSSRESEIVRAVSSINARLLAYKAQPALIRLLTSSNQKIRAASAQVLGKMGGAASSAVPTLIEQLEDEQTRFVAIQALLAISSNAMDDVPAASRKKALAALLRSSDQKEKLWALDNADCFGREAGAALSAANLLELAKDRDVSAKAMSTLARRGLASHPDTLRALLQWLESRDGSLTFHALALLKDLGPKAEPIAGQVIRIYLTSSELALIRGLPAVIEKMGSAGVAAMPDALRALESSDRLIQSRALIVLAALGPKASPALPKLIAMVKDVDRPADSNLFKAFRSVSRSNRSDALAALIDVLDHPPVSGAHRILAVEALGEMGPDARTAVPALTRALPLFTDKLAPDDVVRSRRSKPTVVEAALFKIDKDWHKNGLVADTLLAFALSRNVRSADGKTLRREAEHRQNALELLVQLEARAKEPVEALIRLLDDKSESEAMRVASCKTLIKLSSANKVIPVLVRQFADPNLRTQFYSQLTKLMTEMGKPAVPAMIERLENEPDAFKKSMVVEALGKMGPRAAAAIPVLRKCQEDPDALLSGVARRALARIEKK